MKIVFAASSQLLDYLRIAPSHLLVSNVHNERGELITCERHAIAWQLYAFAHDSVIAGASGFDLVMIAAYSRYTLLIPNIVRGDTESIEQRFFKTMSQHMNMILQNAGASTELMHDAVRQYRLQSFGCDWFHYNAQNLRQQYSKICTLLRQFYRQNPLGSLDDNSAAHLASQINKVNWGFAGQQTLPPIARITQEWLIRFGAGNYTLLPQAPLPVRADNLHQLYNWRVGPTAHAKVLDIDFLRRRRMLA